MPFVALFPQLSKNINNTVAHVNFIIKFTNDAPIWMLKVVYLVISVKRISNNFKDIATHYYRTAKQKQRVD